MCSFSKVELGREVVLGILRGEIMSNVSRGLLAFVCVLSTGCASIVSKSKYPVTIYTEPSAAKVEVKDQDGMVRFVGTSPVTAMLDSGHGYFTRARYTVTASKDGFTSAMTPLQTSINPWYWGNIAIGGLIGILIVDPITGAMFEIDSPMTTMSLAPEVMAVNADTGRLKQLRELRDGGVLSEAEYQAKKKVILQNL